MEIRLGPAGIPTVCKGSSIDGVKSVAELELSAMEIEFVRGVKMSNSLAKELGIVAKNLDVELSVHAPYFINLASSEKEKIAASKLRILDSLERGAAMHATVVVVHAGYYGKDKGKAGEMIFSACSDLADKIKQNGWRVLLGLETTGKQSQWGTLDEIIELCKKNKGCTVALDPAHIYARQGGKIDYKEIFDKLEVLKLGHLHCHFSGINYSVTGIGRGNERSHLPLKQAGPPFEEFAKEILKRKIDATIISESPVLEQDSLVMKKIFEKLGYEFGEAGLKKFTK